MKKSLKCWILSFLILVQLSNGMEICAQNNFQKITAELDSARKGIGIAFDYAFDSTNEKSALEFIRKFDNEKNEKVNFHVQRLKALIALTTKNLLIKQEIAEDYLMDLSAGKKNLVQYQVSILLQFKESDFSEKSRKLMASLFKETDDNNFILLCGLAKVKELIPQLMEIAKDFDRSTPYWKMSRPWFCSLALARLGSPVNIDKMITAVETELDPAIRVIKLLKYLAYTRNPDCIRILQKYLESNDYFESNDPLKLKHNIFALRYLVEYLEDFPVKPKKGEGYTDEDLKTAKDYFIKLRRQ